MTTTRTKPDNLDRFHAAIDAAGLTPGQRRSVSNHLLGGASILVPADLWDEAVERAIADATKVTR